MGWKAIKEHYGIKHLIQVTPKGICIGAAHLHDLIVIEPDGTVSSDDFLEDLNPEIAQYRNAMEDDPQKLLELMNATDTFERSQPVYTCKDGALVEKACEHYGWPNCTHDGELMNESFYSSREQALKSLQEAMAMLVRSQQRTVAQLEEQLLNAKNRLSLLQERAANLQ